MAYAARGRRPHPKSMLHTLTATALCCSLLSCSAVAAQTRQILTEDFRDMHNRPHAVLDFLAVEPGWTVLDLLAGDGYWSQHLAQRVGTQGKVFAHNNQTYATFTAALSRRLTKTPAPQIEVYVRELDDILLPSGSVDMVLMANVYHDVYFVGNGWRVSADRLFALLQRILRPGGVLAIIDHKAASASGIAAVARLHRIDPEFVLADLAARGFHLEATSDLLHNPNDDLSLPVFAADVRGMTSRFVYRFVKPREP